MKLLHKESIRTCSELDEAIHQAETDRIMEVIFLCPIMIVRLMTLLRIATTRR